MTPLSILTPRHEIARQRDSIMGRAADLKVQTNALLELSSEISATREAQTTREIELAQWEDKLRKKAAALDERQRRVEAAERLAQSHALLEQPAPPSTRGQTVNKRSASGPEAVAREILRCGALARGEAADDVPLPTHPVARSIVLAAMMARGEIEPDEQTVPARPRRPAGHYDPKAVAEQIILAGKMRRGEV